MKYKLQIKRCMSRKTGLPLAATALLLLSQGCNPAQDAKDISTEKQVEELLLNPHMAVAMQRASEHLLALRFTLGLDNNAGFLPRSAVVDEFGLTHMRYDQTYRGIKVFEGDVIVELSANQTPTSLIQALQPGIQISTEPSLSETQALGIAHGDLQPQGPYAESPTIERVIYPMIVERERANRLRGQQGELNAEDIERTVERYALAYHVHTALENGPLETKHTDYIIDATSGAILKKWSTLYTAAATGTGLSAYSGTVSLGTNSLSGGNFELRDVMRSMNIATYNLNHGTSGTGSVFTDSDNSWGDGKNYNSGSSTTSANGQTAGVDAHYGTERTFDYYLNVHGRNGIDGSGKATYNRVHYSSNFDNAFWDDSCFCMTYGDGSSFKVLTSIDVAGHEMTHGVTSRTAKLTYSGESGGLNEAMSDIHGTMVEFYARSGSGSNIGDAGGNWTIGEQLTSTPLRYMYKPSKDGSSKDAWSSTLGRLDVHFSSGPMNRAFYFLSQGANKSASSDYYSSYLPGGMAGIGNDKAARIAFRALAAKMTASTNYAGARTAFLAAATDLYGANSPEYAAVQNAFAAINVGTPASGGGGDTTAPTTSLTAPIAGSTLSGTVNVLANAMDNVAVTKVEFYAGTTLVGSSTASPYSIAWNTTAVADGAYVLTSKAYDAAGNVGTSAPISVTVKNGGGGGGDTTAPTTSLTAPTAGSTLSGTVNVSANAMDNVAVTKVEFYAGTTLVGSSTASPYSIAWNTTAVADGAYVLTSKAYDAAGNIGTSAPISVTVKNGGGSCENQSQLLTNPGFESGETGWTATAEVIGNSGQAPPHSGSWVAWLGGYGTAHSDFLYQDVTIPADACTAKLSFWLLIDTNEFGSSVYDRLRVTVQDTSGTVLATLANYSNVNAGPYAQKTFDLSAYKGRTIRVSFKAVEDKYVPTSFLIDDAAVDITR